MKYLRTSNGEYIVRDGIFLMIIQIINGTYPGFPLMIKYQSDSKFCSALGLLRSHQKHNIEYARNIKNKECNVIAYLQS
jgi:hypothetical protein